MSVWSFLFFVFITVGAYLILRNVLSESVVSLKASSRYYNTELLNKLDQKVEHKNLKSQREILEKDFWKDL